MSAPPEPETHPYQNRNLAVDDRVEDLIGRMTLAEKVAQVRAVSLRDSVAAEEGGIVQAVRDGMGQGIGQIENTFDPRDPRASVEEVNGLQRLLKEKTRLGIPALIGAECAHGHAAKRSTVLPVPLAMASSWNPDLVEEAFGMVAREARARGGHEAHTPVLDLGRDPRWGRIEETFGEDTYLVTQFGLAAVSGLQGGRSGNPATSHLIAAPKHFAGYGQVVGGRNFAATPIDDLTLFDEILPPFKAVVQEAKAQGMMASHCDVRGVPAHGNRWLLTELLRDQWGFEGYVVSDYNDVPRLAFFQEVAESNEGAAALAIEAGMDMDLPLGSGYADLEKAIQNRPELATALDRSVRRVLRQKFRLGLFENPYCDPDAAADFVGRSANRELAESVACESIILLKNEQQLLPLDRNSCRSIAVIGPNADSRDIGNYTVRHDNPVTILDGIRTAAGSEVAVRHEKGCSIARVGWDGSQSAMTQEPLDAELPGIEAAVALATRSDVAVLCLGGTVETSREAFYVDGIKGDRATLGMLGNQNELARRVIATGTPTVIVTMGGRPYSTPELARQAGAWLNTFYLGQTNGNAVAKVLFGEINPSGKLPLTVPRSVGQLPVYYSQKRISFYKDYLDEEPGPLFPFGHGLSYTTFVYSEISLDKPAFRIDETVRFRITIKNTGPLAGAEVAQIYFRDHIASIIRPAKQLIRFAKPYLKPGEERELIFELDPAVDLSFSRSDLTRVVEPGAFTLYAGSSSTDIRSQATFHLEPLS